MSEKMDALNAQIVATQKAAAGPDPMGDEALAASRPSCTACGDWDETVTDVEVTSRTTAKLCAACAATEAVLVGIAAEDGLDEVDE